MSTVTNFLRDYVDLLVEEARSVERGDDYDEGRLMGLVEALSTVRNQCVAFGIPWSDVGLEDDPESLLNRGTLSTTSTRS